MHTFEYTGDTGMPEYAEYTFHYNSDFSGEVIIHKRVMRRHPRSQGAPTTIIYNGEMKVSAYALMELVAQAVRARKIEKLERADAFTLLYDL